VLVEVAASPWTGISISGGSSDTWKASSGAQDGRRRGHAPGAR
jgi:hypothetical protein